MIRKPDFICIGAQKAGTTSLHDIIVQHPDVFLSDRKENHFFDWDDRYEKGVDWWLNEFYSEIKNERVVGTFTPDYLYFPKVPPRIKETYGESDPKFIVVLRHPADRAFSQYLMSKGRGFEDLSFEEAISVEKYRLQKGFYEQYHFSYIDRGFYVPQIKRYLELFPRENFLFLSFEKDIKNNLDQTLIRIQDFIGIESISLDSNTHSNSAKESHSKAIQRLTRGDYFLKKLFIKIFGRRLMHRLKRKAIEMNESKTPTTTKLSKEERSQIFDSYYLDELDELMSLTGLDLKHWKD